MRLLHVVPSYWPATRYGGPIFSVRGLVAALSTRGHDVEVATTDVDGPDRLADSGRRVSLDGAKVHYFPSRAVRRLYFSLELARFVSRHAPDYDVIHLHSVFLFPTNFAGLVARRKGVPYVLSPRGMLEEQLIDGRNRLLKKLWIGMIERANVAGAHLHFTAEREARACYALGLAGQGATVIPNGHDANCEEDGEPPIHAPYVLYLGRLSWKKNLDIVVDALASLPPHLHLVLAGPDNGGIQATLTARAHALGQAARLHFTGELGQEKWRWLAHAQAIVLMSRSENFGNVLLEAAVCGCPSVVSPGVGPAADIARSGAGLVAEPEPQALADTLAQLLAQRERHAAAAQSWAEHYRWSRLVGAYETMYEEAAGQGNND